jgi:hypothetical protein
LADLSSLRHNAFARDDILALGELLERFAAQVTSARLGVLAAIDARDDVIPKARVGDASAVFAHHVLGQRRVTARRDAHWASLLRPEVGDLPAVGAAFAAGDVSAAHVEVAVRAHHDLGARAREALVDCMVPDADNDQAAEELRAALAGLSDAFTAKVRQIRVVDVLLAHYARRMTVAELEAIAKRIVATLNPPDPAGAHERRFLFMSQLPSGEWRGRFSCGPDQGLRLKRALAAWSAPRHGKAIDQDGVEHTIPDTRDRGARQMDAVTDIVNVALAKTGITLPADPSAAHGQAQAHAPDDGEDADGFWHADDPEDESPDEPTPDQPDPEQPHLERPHPEEPPPGEGETVVLREPGALVAPYPSADLVLVAGIEHVAAAWAHRQDALPMNLDDGFNGWLRERLRTRRTNPDQSQASATVENACGSELQAEEFAPEEPPGQEQPRKAPPGQAPPGGSPPTGNRIPGNAECGRERHDGDLASLTRALSPYAVPARVEHAGLVDATTLELVACTATVRAALLAPNGALLDLGRAQRLASAPQKTALLARDGGCIIPGCTVPGDACDAHHVRWWTRQGPTDLDNMALVCGRHHTEVHQETWQVQMRDGVPWVTPPSWMDPRRPLLRNAVHHPGRDVRGAPDVDE